MMDTYSKAAVGYERIREVFDTKPQVLRPSIGACRLHASRGEIEFDHVHFSYAPGQPVLKDISFKIAPGQMTALVGPTGAGKTTIASLIGRFYDPDSGSVKIDGQDVRDFLQKSLRDQMSFVLQESILFRASDLAEHRLRQARGDAQPKSIAPRSSPMPHEFITQLPEDYDTDHWRAGRYALRRTASAHCHRPRHHTRYADPHHGRTQLWARRGL